MLPRMPSATSAVRGAGLLGTALSNPALSAYLIGKHVIPERYDSNHDPHNYRAEYGDGAAFLAL